MSHLLLTRSFDFQFSSFLRERDANILPLLNPSVFYTYIKYNRMQGTLLLMWSLTRIQSLALCGPFAVAVHDFKYWTNARAPTIKLMKRENDKNSFYFSWGGFNFRSNYRKYTHTHVGREYDTARARSAFCYYFTKHIHLHSIIIYSLNAEGQLLSNYYSMRTYAIQFVYALQEHYVRAQIVFFQHTPFGDRKNRKRVRWTLALRTVATIHTLLQISSHVLRFRSFGSFFSTTVHRPCCTWVIWLV